jgi:hypothetical protein
MGCLQQQQAHLLVLLVQVQELLVLQAQVLVQVLLELQVVLGLPLQVLPLPHPSLPVSAALPRPSCLAPCSTHTRPSRRKLACPCGCRQTS